MASAISCRTSSSMRVANRAESFVIQGLRIREIHVTGRLGLRQLGENLLQLLELERGEFPPAGRGGPSQELEVAPDLGHQLAVALVGPSRLAGAMCLRSFSTPLQFSSKAPRTMLAARRQTG